MHHYRTTFHFMTFTMTSAVGNVYHERLPYTFSLSEWLENISDLGIFKVFDNKIFPTDFGRLCRQNYYLWTLVLTPDHCNITYKCTLGCKLDVGSYIYAAYHLELISDNYNGPKSIGRRVRKF